MFGLDSDLIIPFYQFKRLDYVLTYYPILSVQMFGLDTDLLSNSISSNVWIRYWPSYSILSVQMFGLDTDLVIPFYQFKRLD